jgi:hypothetical protein
VTSKVLLGNLTRASASVIGWLALWPWRCCAVALAITFGTGVLALQAQESPTALNYRQEPPERDEVLASLISVLGDLRSQIYKLNFTSAHLRDLIHLLEERLPEASEDVQKIKASPLSFSNPFLNTLNFDYQAFQSVNERIQHTITVTLDGATRALNACWDLAAKSRFLGNRKTDLVTVTVNTLDDQGAGVSGCYVWIVPVVKDDSEHKLRFDHQSTPTAQKIAPALYYFWTEKGGKSTSRTQFWLGNDDQPTREIDLDAPK